MMLLMKGSTSCTLFFRDPGYKDYMVIINAPCARNYCHGGVKKLSLKNVNVKLKLSVFTMGLRNCPLNNLLSLVTYFKR